MKFEELKLGMTSSRTKVITEQDVLTFSEISTDNNPLHIDEEAAAKGFFKKRVAHGMLVASLISAVLGTQLPGQGTIYLGQNLQFKKPVFLGDEITAVVELIELLNDSHRAVFKTSCVNQDGVEVISGTATVLVR